MKKFYIMMAMAISALTVSAQQVLNLSTTNGSNLQKFDGQVCKVNVSRLVFNGWNTISLPFAMTENELNETFGQDCRLERLVGAEEAAGVITLLFQDCKARGIEANVPYILYYNGANGTKRFSKETLVTQGEAIVGYSVNGGTEMVRMAAAQTKTSGVGLYGILAVDNSEAKFVAVDETKSGFHATRCYVKLDSGNTAKLATRHLAAGDATGIDAIVGSTAKVDVYNINGVKVATGISAEQLRGLQPGVYVVNGQKVVVK